MKTQKRFTKRPMVLSSYRVTPSDNELFKAAAGKEGISQSEFLRRAIREKASRVLMAEVPQEATTRRTQ